MQHWKSFETWISSSLVLKNYGTAGRWSYKQRTGTVIRLDGAQSDELQVLVQDDLTAETGELVDFQIKMQGHVEASG